MSEFGIENMDNANELVKIVDDLIPSELSKINLFQDRPQMENII